MEIFGEEIIKKAVDKFGIGRPQQVPNNVNKMFVWKTTSDTLTPIEILKQIGEMKAKKEKEEYEKLLANGNGDNGHD